MHTNTNTDQLPAPATQDLIGKFMELALQSREYRFGPYRRVFFWDNEAIDWGAALLLAQPGDLLRVVGHGRVKADATILIEIPKLAVDMTAALVHRSEMLRWTE